MATLSVGGQLVATNDTLSNAVQDNITRLGTITSATFPAGHIIQVVPYKQNNRWTGTGLSNIQMSITPHLQTSIIVIQSYIMGEGGTQTHDTSLRLHSSVGGYISDGSVGYTGGSGKLSEGTYTGDDTNSTPGNMFHQAYEDHNQTGTITYKWYVTSPDGNPTSTIALQGCVGSANESSPSWMVAWEVMA